MNHVDARFDASSVAVAKVPGDGRSDAAGAHDKVTRDVGDGDVRIGHETHNAQIAAIFGTHGIGIAIEIAEIGFSLPGIGLIGEDAAFARDVEYRCLRVEREGENIVGEKRGVAGVEVLDFGDAVVAEQEESTAERAYPLAVEVIDSDAGARC